MAAQAQGGEPAYVVRGKQTEVRQRALEERLGRFRDVLAAALERGAPELLSSLEPPPPGVVGYQLLPRVISDVPPSPSARPQVVRYSWAWTDTLIARETATLARLEAQLAQIPASGADRATYQALAAEYRKAVERRRPIDADIDYNRLWQKQIADDRPLFDRITRRLDAFVERQAIEDALAVGSDAERRAVRGIKGIDLALTGEKLQQALAGRAESLTREVAAGIGAVAPPAFVRVQPANGHERVISVPVYTDIADAGFVDAFKSAVETQWHVRAGEDAFRVELVIAVLTPEQLYCGQSDGTRARAAGCTPPARGDRIDLAAHAARFPKDGAVLTTGASSLRIVAGRVLALAPHDVARRVFAHEFGHLLGFPDAYLRGYRDLVAEGFQVLELVPDAADIMSSPGTGSVLARHFEALLRSNDIQAVMSQGLDALYQRDDPIEAVARFRAVLKLNPTHYGATLQLAKALDRAGKGDEALTFWREVLRMAEAARDAETTNAARARLSGGK